MPYTTIPLALNAGAGVAVWISDISLPAKIVLTVLLVAKCILFFYSAWMSDSERFQKFGVTLCIIANAGLIIYGLISAAYHISITVAIMLIVLLVWSFAVVYDFSFKKKEKE